MACACAVAAPSRATVSGPGAAPPPGRGSRVSCRRSARRRAGGRARVSRDTNGAEAEPGSKGPIPQDDSGYLLTLGLGSVGGAAAVKYGSVLLPDITRPNIVEALLMVSLPMAVAALILLKLSSTSTQD
ncbi:hypothetical protein CFC21_094405 [Triticum aestivum]|uniref:Uncharacterized protein n=3 Tax=Triticinae TaxID=1648030 RepID=A0A453PZ22_AEGTS|nr:uncharacterized protein LOC109742334 [Aegilops tauschii subsp. strangulata]XP_044421509.1 uncharacterized protein LOC123146010 [Triticum aestivum]KAF7091862.1 hypothetical protein CFC21_094405 [Triticum aestivum]